MHDSLHRRAFLFLAPLLAICFAACSDGADPDEDLEDSESGVQAKQRCNNNGVCGAGESCKSCPKDCGACAVCGDGTCNGNETCGACPADCGVCPPVCGDGSCDAGENCGSCGVDCGACAPAPVEEEEEVILPVSFCGDAVCDDGEDCGNCTTDCGACPSACGDGTCSAGESCGSCAVDCGACEGNECTVDSDCVPATCCHPAACVPLSQAPICGGACDTGCQWLTLDCGQGYCGCQNGYCAAHFVDP